MINTKEQATLSELAKVKLTVPDNAGGAWQPVPHHDLIVAVGDRLHKEGWRVVRSVYHLGRGGADLAAGLTLRGPDQGGGPLPPGYRHGLGIATSNARRRALTVFAGVVAGDGTGVVLAEACRIGHSGYAEPEELAEGVVRAYAAVAPREVVYLKAYKRKVLRRQQWQELLLRAGREDVMPWSRIGDVDELVRAKLDSSKSCRAWDLLRAFSSVLPRNPPQDQMDQSLAFTRMVRGAGPASQRVSISNTSPS